MADRHAEPPEIVSRRHIGKGAGAEAAVDDVRGLPDIGREADRIATHDHPEIEPDRPLQRQHAKPEQPHADQHHAKHVEEVPVQPVGLEDHIDVSGLPEGGPITIRLRLDLVRNALRRRFEVATLLLPSGNRRVLLRSRFVAGVADRGRRLIGCVEGERVAAFAEAPQGAGEQCCEPDRHQPFPGQLAERIEEEGDDPVGIENVAMPEQDEGVDHAETDQPEIAAHIDIGGVGPPLRFQPRGEEDHAGAEQHREERALRAFEADFGDDPGREIDPGRAA